MENAVKTIWKLDTDHSEIVFKVKHLMVSTVTGSFREFEGQLEGGQEDFNGASIHFQAQVASIDTRNAQRDTHVKSADFFNAEEFPQLKFESKEFTKLSEEKYRLIGDLEIRGNQREVSLDVEYNGSVVDPYGQYKAGFEITGKISRKAFGLTWNAVTEKGSIVVSDEVKLHMHVQLIRQ